MHSSQKVLEKWSKQQHQHRQRHCDCLSFSHPSAIARSIVAPFFSLYLDAVLSSVFTSCVLCMLAQYKWWCATNDSNVPSPVTLCFMTWQNIHVRDTNELIVGLLISNSYDVLFISFTAYFFLMYYSYVVGSRVGCALHFSINGKRQMMFDRFTFSGSFSSSLSLSQLILRQVMQYFCK